MIRVLDASIAVKWFFPSEPDHLKAMKVLEELSENPSTVLVPDLFHLEVAAVLVKKVPKDSSFVQAAIEQIYDLGLATVPTGRETLFGSTKLAVKLGITVYDALYLFLAQSAHGKWLTADSKAKKRVPPTHCILLSET